MEYALCGEEFSRLIQNWSKHHKQTIGTYMTFNSINIFKMCIICAMFSISDEITL